MCPEDDAKAPSPPGANTQSSSPRDPGQPAGATLSAIEPANGPGDEDEFDPTEGYDIGSNASVSVTSSVFAHTYEHGRRYHCFKNGRYPIPNDEDEQAREDMKHAMLMELTDGVLFYAPIGDHPQKILDIGTGTGEAILLPYRCHGVPRSGC
jgi:hypothetical protein